MKQQQGGFTLIELVIVIVILGILAATALPRFFDLAGDARVASLNGVAGSLRSAAMLARATQLARGLTSGSSVTVDGQTITMINGYPSAASISNALTDVSGYTVAAPGTTATFTLRTNCYASYTDATGSNIFTVTIASSGCGG